ncbi:MAG TPA: aminopeptidase [Gaiellaceae bacterium]|nr:aminopeptidase [Gaiellaceae bacterium]
MAVADPRLERLARLLVERCLDVQPRWQVLVIGHPAARPLLEEVSKQVARRGAYALLRLRFTSPGDVPWLQEAAEELVGSLGGIETYEWEHADAYAVVLAPDNTRDGSELDPKRLALRTTALRPLTLPFLNDERPWVGCYFPTNAVAQDAGMTLSQFEDFYWRSMLVDWERLARDMQRIADLFDAGEQVRIVGDGTDLRFSLAGRRGKIDALGANMPGGEVFYSPVEDSAEGVIAYSEYPACYLSHEVEDVRFRFEGGTIVEASAASDEEFLLTMLDTDEGARRLGEFGIGCNPGIQQHMRNTLFDEKIEGTVHLAIGTGFANLGGTNESAVHWDMVKDLRRGGRIELDGRVVQQDGRWCFP